MSQLYVWESRGMSPSEARHHFERSLADQTDLYNRHLSTRCKFRFVQLGDVFVGQISGHLGIRGWQPWLEEAGLGIAWAGVCEDFLGVDLDRDALPALVADVIVRPHRLSDLCGGFSVCAWDEATESVAVATAATQHQTLWETSGPLGYAVGSRAKATLGLVGREPEFDAEEASVFTAYKYLIGDGCFFKGVRRVSSRQQLLLKKGRPPERQTYQTLGEYLGQRDSMSMNEAIELCSTALRDRVARQARASENPVLNLTGGRDSRCIAAALWHVGFRGPASTGGSPGSADVVLAARVSEALGLAHVRSPGVGPTELLSRLVRHRDRAHAWTQLSEGVATIKHGLHRAEFFESVEPYPPVVVPAFNGHHAGLERSGVRTYTPERLNRNVGEHLARSSAVRDRFEAMRVSLISELDALGEPASRWPELYYWQRDALQWGQDNMLVSDLFSWNWTPLFDKTLIRAGWHLPEMHRNSDRFVEAITTELAPALRAVPYEIERPKRILPARLISFGLRTGRSLFGRSSRRRHHASETERELWDRALFGPDHAQWQDLITPEFVRESIEGKHPGETHWNVATVQLVIESGGREWTDRAQARATSPSRSGPAQRR